MKCCASYLDVQGIRAGYLFIKEMSVGVGGGVTVLISRNIAANLSSEIICGIGIVFILLACILLYDEFNFLQKND